MMLFPSRVCPPAGAEPTPKHQELQGRKIGYFIMNGVTKENRMLMLKSPHSLMACRLQITEGKITRHRGLGGSGSSWELIGQRRVRILNHFFSSWGQLWGLFQHPSVWSHGKVARGSSQLRSQKRKHDLGQHVIFSLQSSRPHDHQSGPHCCLRLPQGSLTVQGKGWVSEGHIYTGPSTDNTPLLLQNRKHVIM